MSRTPLREALVRLASEGLVELEPNRGAKVSALQFGDVIDHYEAMDVFQPVLWHFAAVRRTDADLDKIRKCLEAFRNAIAHEDAEAIVQGNYEIHSAIGAGDAKSAQDLGRRYNAHVREQITNILSASLAPDIEFSGPLKR